MHKLKHKTKDKRMKYRHETMKGINTIDTYISGGKPVLVKKTTHCSNIQLCQENSLHRALVGYYEMVTLSHLDLWTTIHKKPS